MKAIITYIKKYKTIFLLLGALLLIFIVGSVTVKADLGGSKVVFEPVSDGAACYVPNRSQQTLCFEAVTVSSDGEDVTTSFWKFPSDWTVYNPVIQPESKTCTNGAFSGGLGWTGMGSGEGSLTHTRSHEVNGTCTITYCFPIKTGTTSTVDATVSWIWYGPETNPEAPPHRPCSSDGYTGPLISCDYSVDPPATVPVCEHVTLNILPETLPAGEVGSYYSQYLTAEPASEPYYWQSSGLSAGISLISSFGHLQGTPTSAGTINFTAYVQGSEWSDGERNYSLTIHPTLTFNPSTLPAARLNTAYTQAVSVSGRDDETPIFSHESGTLPAGITFSTGAFTGTPTEMGTFENLVIKATYTDGLVKTKTYTLKVLPEHLFTWTPLEPNVKSYVTFTAIEGYGNGNYVWSKSGNPGGVCNTSLYYYNQIVDIYFWESGQHQVCLSIYDGYQYIIEEQWVTVKIFAIYLPLIQR